MARVLHVIEQADGWAVRPSNAKRATSIHRTQAEAEAAGRRLAQKSGDAEVVVHHADGRFRDSDTMPPIDRREGGSPRAPRAEGPRTTLRVPDDLADTADRLGMELGISRNDALLRLATRGAQLYALEQSIAARRAARWAAVVPGDVDMTQADLPSPAEIEDILNTLDDDEPAVAR
jgi:hypothetical protein